MNATKGIVALLTATLCLFACSRGDPPALEQAPGRDLFLMHSANAPREAPNLLRRYFRRGDMVRIESLPPDLNVSRRHIYALPTSLRAEWAGWPGVRHWVDRGCGPGSPGTIIYDPERRDLTPAGEWRRVGHSVRTAARLVTGTGCHRFGIAPGASLLFGLEEGGCSYDLGTGQYRDIAWRSIDVVDIQAQRLLADRCESDAGIDRYNDVVRFISSFARRRNPDIIVVTQVSFRDNSLENMQRGIQEVANVVDGVYYSYPSTNPEWTCNYCSPEQLMGLLEFLRPTD